MEGGYKLWDEVLKTIQVLTSWPLVVLYLSLLFRRAVTRQIPSFFKSLEELIERLAKVKYKGLEADFELDKLREVAAEHSPELAQELLIKIDAPTPHDTDALVDEQSVDE